MNQIDERKCARVGMKMSLWFATPGALVFLWFILYRLVDLLFGQRERQQGSGRFLLYNVVLGPILIGALYLSAALLGRQAGKFLCRKPRGSLGAALIGILVALGCLVAGVVVWCIFQVIELILFVPGIGFSDILFLPALWGIAVFIYGLIPAILLGSLYGVLVKRRLAHAGWQKA